MPPTSRRQLAGTSLAQKSSQREGNGPQVVAQPLKSSQHCSTLRAQEKSGARPETSLEQAGPAKALPGCRGALRSSVPPRSSE